MKELQTLTFIRSWSTFKIAKKTLLHIIDYRWLIWKSIYYLWQRNFVSYFWADYMCNFQRKISPMDIQIFPFLFKVSKSVYVTKEIFFDRSYDDSLSTYSRLLGQSFSELFFSYALLRSQVEFISFNISSCRILIASCKILIMPVVSNKKSKELTIVYAKLCRNVAIFYRQELVSLFQVQEKQSGREFKIKFFE